MCRRCGEPDRRGNSRDRRATKRWLLDTFGDGVSCPCTWCAKPLYAGTVQKDRLMQGGPYARWNLVPACGPCNRRRTYENLEVASGCAFGPVGALVVTGG